MDIGHFYFEHTIHFMNCTIMNIILLPYNDDLS